MWKREHSAQICFEDTVDDAAPLDVPLLAEVKLHELPEAAGVVVVDGLSVPKCLHDGAVERGEERGY